MEKLCWQVLAASLSTNKEPDRRGRRLCDTRPHPGCSLSVFLTGISAPWVSWEGFHASRGLVEPLCPLPALQAAPAGSRARQSSAGLAAMKAGAAGWGGHPDPPGCGAAPDPPVLLLALLGLLSVPVARGEYGAVGRTRDTCLDPTWLLRGWAGGCHPPSLGTDLGTARCCHRSSPGEP